MSGPANATILVVDDHPTNVSVLFEMLTKEGYRVLAAEDGRFALESARKGKPDLILLDVMMPGWDGFEVCRQLKASPDTAAIPVVFTTALSDEASKAKAYELGAADFLSKPLMRKPTLTCIERVLHGSGRKPPQRKTPPRETPVTEVKSPPAKDPFVSRALHDLRGSLGGALGFVEAIEQELSGEADPSTLREYQQWLRKTLVSMDESLHVFSLRQNLPRHPIENANCDFGEILRDAVTRVADLFPHIPMELQADSPLPAMQADRFLLSEYLFLLLRAILSLRTDEAKIVIGLTSHQGVDGAPAYEISAPGRVLDENERAAFLTHPEASPRARLRDVGLSLEGLDMLAARLPLVLSLEPLSGGNRFVLRVPPPA
jgi:CheY-like chemotaxis protein